MKVSAAEIRFDDGAHVDVMTVLEELKAYRAIGTVEEFKVLKEKNEPKKATIIKIMYGSKGVKEFEWKCPMCDLTIIEETPCDEYCMNCGQKMDWSEENGEID